MCGLPQSTNEPLCKPREQAQGKPHSVEPLGPAVVPVGSCEPAASGERRSPSSGRGRAGGYPGCRPTQAPAWWLRRSVHHLQPLERGEAEHLEGSEERGGEGGKAPALGLGRRGSEQDPKARLSLSCDEDSTSNVNAGNRSRPTPAGRKQRSGKPNASRWSALLLLPSRTPPRCSGKPTAWHAPGPDGGSTKGWPSAQQQGAREQVHQEHAAGGARLPLGSLRKRSRAAPARRTATARQLQRQQPGRQRLSRAPGARGWPGAPRSSSGRDLCSWFRSGRGRGECGGRAGAPSEAGRRRAGGHRSERHARGRGKPGVSPVPG